MIYLDNAATTKPLSDGVKYAEKYLYENFYNPSALYAEGYKLHRELSESRTNILKTLCNPKDFQLIITSCGTEADNQALFCGAKRGNIVTTAGEHSAIFSCLNALKERGIEVRVAGLNSDGSVNTEQLLNLVDSNTSLVSVIHVNNETGAINDINFIAQSVKRKNPRTLFHSDGVQAFGKIPFRLGENIDLYSVSAHKIGAAKGTGALFKRITCHIAPFVCGGGQEEGLRSGTENVFGIKLFEYAAVRRYENIEKNLAYVKQLNVKMRTLLDGDLFTVLSPSYGSPYILTVTANGVRGEIILHEVDDKGLIIGTGSACSSNEKKRYSRVILACGITEAGADGVLRISFCPETTVDEVIVAAEILNSTVRARREIMG